MTEPVEEQMTEQNAERVEPVTDEELAELRLHLPCMLSDEILNDGRCRATDDGARFRMTCDRAIFFPGERLIARIDALVREREELRKLANEYAASAGIGPLACHTCGLREGSIPHTPASSCEGCREPASHHPFTPSAALSSITGSQS